MFYQDAAQNRLFPARPDKTHQAIQARQASQSSQESQELRKSEAKSQQNLYINALALRLYDRFLGERLTTLERLAAVDYRRLCEGRLSLAFYQERLSTQLLPDDPRYSMMRRVARRTAAKSTVRDLANPQPVPRRYHRRLAAPPWSKDMLESFEADGFVFYD